MATPESRNLILLTVDSWRADFAERHAGVDLLPSVAAMAPRRARFEHFYANAPWTTPALVTLMTGESPARHQVTYQWSAPREGCPALARRLQEAGYAVPNLCHLNAIQGYQNLGFDPREAPEAPASPEEDALLRAILAHRNGSRPFFLWHHYRFLHLPYQAPEPCRRRMGIEEGVLPQHLLESVCSHFVVPRGQFSFALEDQDLIQRLYAAGVLQLDAFLKRLFEVLQEGDLVDRTTFVLTADHGEELLDHGHVGHASTSHHATLHEEVLHVPLFIFDERIEGPMTITARMQGMDLHSTVLSLLGLKASGGPGTFDFSQAILSSGGPLPPERRDFYFQGARKGFRTPREQEGQTVEGVSDGHRKVIFEAFDAPRCMRYDLDADPGEHHPRLFDPEAFQEERGWLDRVRGEVG